VPGYAQGSVPGSVPGSVLVIGGGWAGLAAAVTLCRHGVAVTLLEAAPRLGGRARALALDGLRVDNGQHLLVGAYHGVRELLVELGISEDRVFRRHPLRLDMRSAQRPWRLRLPRLPAPLHLLAGLLGARGLDPGERYRALRLCLALARPRAARDEDPPLGEFLRDHGQGEALQQRLWEPLCLALLNTPLALASTRVFATTLRAVFLHRRRDSDLLIPRGDLDAVLPAPARDFLQRHGATVRLRCRARRLLVSQGRLRGVVTADGEQYLAEETVLALPPAECLRLIRDEPACAGLRRQLEALRHAPICTAYLRYPPGVHLDQPMVGLLDGLGQWLFDRGYSGTPGIMAVVISGPGPHVAWPRARLARRIQEELADYFPRWPPPERSWIIREKRATFLCQHGVEELRPGVRSPLPHGWLAGDYLDTGYPATLEGAVRSGRQCAHAILAR